jgi:hypothetical protein
MKAQQDKAPECCLRASAQTAGIRAEQAGRLLQGMEERNAG